MGNNQRLSGYISAVDCFRLLQAGLTVYVVSAPKDSNALPLEGGWKDSNGKVHLDCAAVCLNPETAHAIGRAYRQECILRITPDGNGNSEVYLIKDSPFARQVALSVAGGYTADGQHLFTAVDREKSIFEDGHCEWVYADIDFVPVKR